MKSLDKERHEWRKAVSEAISRVTDPEQPTVAWWERKAQEHTGMYL